MWHPDSKVRTTVGTVVAILISVAAGVMAWASLRADVAAQHKDIVGHELRLSELETRLSRDHDILLEIRGDVKALRDKVK